MKSIYLLLALLVSAMIYGQSAKPGGVHGSIIALQNKQDDFTIVHNLSLIHI